MLCRARIIKKKFFLWSITYIKKKKKITISTSISEMFANFLSNYFKKFCLERERFLNELLHQIIKLMIKRTEAITHFWEAVVRKCSVTKVFLEISQNSQENTGARVSFIIKMQVWPATLLRKRLWHRCLPVNFVKSLRTPYLQNACGGCFWFFLIGPWFIRTFRLWNYEK